MAQSQPTNGNFALSCKALLQITSVAVFFLYPQTLFASNKTEEKALIKTLMKPILSTEHFKADLKRFTKEEHPFGSRAQKRLADWVVKRVSAKKVVAKTQTFKALTPNPKALLSAFKGKTTRLIEGQNIIANAQGKKDCVILFGSHYDTKVIKEGPYKGANDSASSSIALIHMVDFVSKHIPAAGRCDYSFVWFDGEESVLDDWYDGEKTHPAKIQDNTYGSRYFVSKLDKCKSGFCFKGKKILGLILLDMIGSKDIQLTIENNSSPHLIKLLREAAKQLSLDHLIGWRSLQVEDDHIPFLNAGISAINLIDFNNLQHWHKPTDTEEKVSQQSVESIAKIALLIAHKLENNIN